MTTVKDIYAHLDALGPFAAQMDFDNSGLLVGDAETAVSTVMLALDVTEEIIEQAAAQGAELILAHHPVIFKARKNLLAGDPAYALARRGVACIAWHTPLDAAPGGVNDLLAQALALWNVAALPPCARMGILKPPVRAAELARTIAQRLHAPVRWCDAGKIIEKAAVCGGSGAFLLPELRALGVDALVTGDAGHHDFIDARRMGLSLFAAGHYETEHPVIPALAERLRAAFPALKFIIAEEPCPVKSIPAP